MMEYIPRNTAYLDSVRSISMQKKSYQGFYARHSSFMKRFAAMLCVMVMLCVELPAAPIMAEDNAAGGLETSFSTEAPEANRAAVPTEADQPVPTEADQPDTTATEDKAPDQQEPAADAPNDEDKQDLPEEESAPGAQAQEQEKEKAVEPDDSTSVNGGSVSLSLGKDQTRIVRLRVSKRETVRITVSGMPVAVRVVSEKDGSAVTGFRTRKADGKWADQLDASWDATPGSYLLMVSAADSMIAGIFTLNAVSASRKQMGGDSAAPAPEENPEGEAAPAETAETAVNPINEEARIAQEAVDARQIPADTDEADSAVDTAEQLMEASPAAEADGTQGANEETEDALQAQSEEKTEEEEAPAASNEAAKAGKTLKTVGIQGANEGTEDALQAQTEEKTEEEKAQALPGEDQAPAQAPRETEDEKENENDDEARRNADAPAKAAETAADEADGEQNPEMGKEQGSLDGGQAKQDAASSDQGENVQPQKGQPSDEETDKAAPEEQPGDQQPDKADGDGASDQDEETTEVSFANKYTATGESNLTGNKTLLNRSFAPGDSFTFTITPQGDAPKPVRRTAADDGTVTETPVDSVTIAPISGTTANIDFGIFKFSSDEMEDIPWTADKTKTKRYTYVIAEQVPPDAKNKDGVAYKDATAAQKAAGGFLAGDMSYDGNAYTVTFTVTASEDSGQLEIARTISGDGVSFVNRYVNKYCVAVSKLWQDDNNRDGKRPETLYVELLQAKKDAEGKTGTPVVYQTGIELSDRNGWTYLVRGVPACDADGNLYVYTWKEYGVDAEGNRVDVSGGKITFSTGATYEASQRVIQSMDPEDPSSPMVVTEITNAHENETVTVRAAKAWDDGDNADGLRRDIVLKLVGTYTVDGKTYTVENISNAQQTIKTTDANLTRTWENLPKNYGGSPIVYTVVEAETPEGYTPVYYTDSQMKTEAASAGLTTYNETDGVWEVWVKNLHTVNTVNITATKAWDDGNAPDVHEAIELTLSSEPEVDIANAVKVIDGKAVGTGLQVTWTNLPEYKDGQKVRYTVTETKGDARYTVSVGEITYTYDADEKLYSGAVTVTNTPIRNMLKLHKAFSFQGTALDLSSLTDAQKQSLTFTVTTQLGGKTYYAAYDTQTTAAQGNIHGKYAVLTTKQSAFTYKDFSDGMLVLENLPAGTYTVTESGAAMLESYAWSEAAYRVGRSGEWTEVSDPESVTVTSIPVGDGDFTQVFFTNEYTEKVGELKVIKNVTVGEGDIAIDADKAYRVAVYRLMKDGKDDAQGTKVYYTTNGKVVTESDAAISNKNVWVEIKAGAANAQMWKKLPVGVYYVEEYGASAAVQGYTLTASTDPESVTVTTASVGSSAEAVTVSNSYEQDRGSLTIEKRIFVDNDELTAPAEGAEESPEYKKMKNEAFYVKVAYTDANGVTWYVTNASGVLAKNPKALKVTLAQPLVIQNIPTGVYQITEVKADGSPMQDGQGGALKLVTSISTLEATARVEKGQGAEAQVINRYTSEQYAVVVRKVWQDDENRDQTRPASIKVSLYRGSGIFQNVLDLLLRNGTKIGEYTLSESNNWIQVVSGLPRYGILGAYHYRWFENTNIDGYTVTVSDPAVSADGKTEITTITNTHETAKVSVTANKLWKNGDADVTATIRNASVTLTLQQKAEGGEWQHVLTTEAVNGAANPVTLKTEDQVGADNWTVTWTNLPKLSGGKALSYRVVESAAQPEGAKAASDTVNVTFEGNSGTATLTNTLPTTQVRVQKVWNDNGDQDGFRPASVKVQLMNGETPVGSAVALDESSLWSYTWSAVSKYDNNGGEITYSVAEVDDAGHAVTEIKRDGKLIYSVSIEAIDSDGVIIVNNTHVTELRSILVRKVWDDADDQDGLRPRTVTIYLDRQVGQKAKEQGYKYITLAKEDTVGEAEWSYVFENLPKFEGGDPIQYFIREDDVENYQQTITEEGDTVTVKNTHTPVKTNASITKAWNDDSDRDQLRPTADEYKAMVHLYADGTEVTAQTKGYEEMTVTVTENQNNTYTVAFAGLPQYASGQEIVYTVKEDSVPGYTADAAEVNAGETLTNTHEPERIDVRITKVWKDNANHDGKRPGEEDFKQYLELLAGNEAVTPQTAGYEDMAVTVTVGENNTYVVTFGGLLKNGRDGKPIQYTVNEDTLPDGYAIEGQSTAAPDGTIINKKDNELIEVTITKRWADDGNRDGKRPTAQEYKDSVHLLADGVEATAETAEYEGMTKVVTDNGDQTYTVSFSQLPKYKAGAEIVYTVQEDAITGYTTDTPVAAPGGVIINTHIPEMYCVAVSKTWIDLDNRFHTRPAKLTVTLQKSSDGGETWIDVQSADLTEANGYAFMVQGLNAFEEGNALKYRWTEKNVQPRCGTG